MGNSMVEFGKLYNLTEDTYVCVTAYGKLTPLSLIQELILEFEEFWNPEDFILHWCACRTFVWGETDEELLRACSSSLANPQAVARLPEKQ